MSDLPTLRRQADLCVMCGQCLPACPTYAISGNEAESPRGRISLILALLKGTVSASAANIAHLDSCLVCRSCERVCPSKVPFSEVMASARSRFGRHRGSSSLARALRLTDSNKERTPASFALLRLYQTSGLQALLRRSSAFRRGRIGYLDSLLPPLVKNAPLESPSATDGTKVVNLFVGCTGPTLDRPTLEAALFLLPRFGFAVRLIEGEVCCGASERYSGALESAQRLQQRNSKVLASTSGPIVAIASGCGATLRDYAKWGHGAEWSERVIELSDLLAHARSVDDVVPLRQTVAVHIPCSQRNGLRREEAPVDLLRTIPEIELFPLPPDCCGGAGDYMVTQPEIASRLADRHLDLLAARNIHLLATTNIGCALHLAAAARRRGQPLEVLHPAVLLARQLGFTGVANG